MKKPLDFKRRGKKVHSEAEEEFTPEEEAFVLKCWEESKPEDGVPWGEVRQA